MSLSRSNAIRVDGAGQQPGDLYPMDEIIQGVLNAAQTALRTDSSLMVNGAAVSASNPIPVDTEAVAGAAFVDGSGTIVTGGQSQQVFAAAATRVYLFLLNLSDTEMWINFGTAAVASQPSIKLVANGGYFEPSVAPNQAVNIFCATTGKAFVAKAA